MDRLPLKRGHRMANGYMKKCQGHAKQTTMGYHLSAIRMTITKRR
jgi:hypothetical protein